jgi:hypothetical protein
MVKSGGDKQVAALLAQLDRIPDRDDAFDPMQWDEQQGGAGGWRWGQVLPFDSTFV